MLFFMSAQYSDSRRARLALVVLASAAFASAFGLSSFCAIVFACALTAWGIILLLRRSFQNLRLLIAIGIVAGVLTMPFFLELVRANANSGTALALAVMPFEPALGLVEWLKINGILLGPRSQQVLFLLMLPLNYFAEFGFFGLVGIVVLRQQLRQRFLGTLDQQLLLVLLVSSLGLSLFVRTDLTKNDFAWRAILPAQFLLLLWAIGPLLFILRPTQRSEHAGAVISNRYVKGLAVLLLLIGALGIGYDLFMVRFHTILSPSDAALSKRTFALRQAYDWINTTLPRAAVVQHNPRLNNPGAGVDHFHGLYAERQLFVSDQVHRAFFRGALEAQYEKLRLDALRLFDNSQASVDEMTLFCERYPVTILVSKDTDRAWSNPESWVWRRTPIYANSFVRVIACAPAARANHPFLSRAVQ